jgi:hypothetical protein
MELTDMVLISCVDLDDRTVMIVVRETWLERGHWFRRDAVTEATKTYMMNIGVGRWNDGADYIWPRDPRHVRLVGLHGGWRLQQRLDAYVEINGGAVPAEPAPFWTLPALPLPGSR